MAATPIKHVIPLAPHQHSQNTFTGTLSEHQRRVTRSSAPPSPLFPSAAAAAAMVSIAVQPPTETQVYRAIYPPVVAQTRVRAGGRHDNTHLFATAALLDADGRVLDGQLGGSLVATGYAVEDRAAGGRHQAIAFAFPDLVLTYAGVYSIRVDVYRVNYESGDTDNATMIEQAETELFYALTEAVAPQRPCE
ncbi:hypothetical protein ACHAQA_001479 [Verticillium albo-atrum]